MVMNILHVSQFKCTMHNDHKVYSTTREYSVRRIWHLDPWTQIPYTEGCLHSLQSKAPWTQSVHRPRKKEGMAGSWSEVVNAHISPSPNVIICIQYALIATYFDGIIQSWPTKNQPLHTYATSLRIHPKGGVETIQSLRPLCTPALFSPSLLIGKKECQCVATPKPYYLCPH